VVLGTSSTDSNGPGAGGLMTSGNFSTVVGFLYPVVSGKLFPPSEAIPYVTATKSYLSAVL
jgi:hypothetical protein